MTGSQRWKTVLLNLIMWLIHCNFVCFIPIFVDLADGTTIIRVHSYLKIQRAHSKA